MKLRRSGIIFLLILLIIEAYIIYTQWLTPLGWGIVPITGLHSTISYLTFWLVWPIVGSVIFAAIMPRILGPVFLKIKKGIWRDYENAYVDLPKPQLFQTRIVRRSLYIGLLTMGFLSVLIYIVPPQLFFPPGSMTDPTIFNMASVASIAGIVVPIAVAIWSPSWSYRDASLVHYKIPDLGKDELYEVEPIHLRYDSFLKGYAGFSSILFIITLVIAQLTSEDPFMAVIVIYVFMHMALMTLPALYVHSRMNHFWLRKNLPKARRFTKSDVRILEDDSTYPEEQAR